MGGKYNLVKQVTLILGFSSLREASAFGCASFQSSLSSRTLKQSRSNFVGRGTPIHTKKKKHRSIVKGTELGMFLGSDGGILGVGTPEIAVIALVGYFILGPTELFKLTKDIGKFIQNVRTLGTEATKSFETTMEDQLQLQEIRKAQSELTDAFNFRRSINVDEEAEVFSTKSPTVATNEPADTTVPTDNLVKKKKRRKRVKKRRSVDSSSGENIPDLDMSTSFNQELKEQLNLNQPTSEEGDDELANRVRIERIQRLEESQKKSQENFDAQKQTQEAVNSHQNLVDLNDSEIAHKDQEQNRVLNEANKNANSRFQSQLSGQWNDQVMANEDKLSPLGTIMDQLAILEEERMAANSRLDEEYKRRAQLEEEFYQQKRSLLEDAANKVSTSAYKDFN